MKGFRVVEQFAEQLKEGFQEINLADSDFTRGLTEAFNSYVDTSLELFKERCDENPEGF